MFMDEEYATIHPSWEEDAEIVRKVGKLMMQQVKTERGTGILISIHMPYNGLYIEPSRADCMVWFGVDKAQSGFVWHVVDAREILRLNNV